jgi:CheY-like chemotaxis protein
MSKEEALLPPDDMPRSEPRKDIGGLRVLVVEDDPPVREHAVRLVRGLGYTVRCASGGQEALRMLASDPNCDILFSDVMMPGLSGGELARTARLLLPRLAVVFVTGHHEDAAVESLQREGSVIVLAKPYRRQVVADALRHSLEIS